MDFNTGLSYTSIDIGIVVNLLTAMPMKPVMRGALFGIGGMCIAAGIWGIFTGSRSEPEGGKPSVTIQQENPYQSPNVIGDHNQLTFNLEEHSWVVTDNQKKKLAEELNKVPPGETYKLVFHVIPGCNRCNVYADNIIEVVRGLQGWEVQGDTYYGLKPSLTGILVGSDPEAPCPPTAVQLMLYALWAADIPYSFFPLKGKDKDLAPAPGFCVVLVGDKPRG